MAEFDYAVDDPLAVKLWERRIARETEKETMLSRFISKKPGKGIIHLKPETQKGPGDKITCGLKTLLTGDGVTEGEDLEGNEESLSTYDDSYTINELSHAARSDDRITPQRVPFSVREEVRDSLTRWYSERMEVGMFNQLCGNVAQTNTKYTGLNAVTAPTANRHMFPNALTTDQAVQADNTAKFDTVGLFEEMITRARTASPQIKPIMVGGRKKYVAFLHDYQIRDLRKAKSTSEITWWDTAAALISGNQLKKSNIYNDAVGEWNDVIIHRSNYVTTGCHSTTNATQSNVRRAILCGAQAMSMSFGRGYSFKKFGWVEETFDYRRKYGASVQNIMGFKKCVFNNEDFGVIVMSTYAAAS